MDAAAEAGILLQNTTMHDLLKCVGRDKKTAFDRLPDNWKKEQVKSLLKSTETTSFDQAKSFGVLLLDKYAKRDGFRAVVALWLAREIKRLNELNARGTAPAVIG